MNPDAVTLYRQLAALPHKPCEMLSEPEAVALAEAARDRVCVEIGSWKGGSTAMLASTARLVVAIDPHHGIADTTGHTRGAPTIEWMRQTVQARTRCNVVIIPEFSRYAIGAVQAVTGTRGVDLLFVDGSHKYDDVRLDLRLYACGLLGRGTEPAFLVMDDLGYASVRQAFDEWRSSEEVAHLSLTPVDLRAWGIEDPIHNRLHEGAVSKMTFFEVRRKW